MVFSSVLVFLHTSEDRVTAEQQRAGIVADHVVTTDEGALPPDAVRRAGRTPEVTAAVGLLRTSVLVQASGALIPVSAQGVTGSARDLAAVQDLDVEKGRLPLKPGEIALDASVARNANVGVGDRIRPHLPDGTRATPLVAATYGRGMGLFPGHLPPHRPGPSVRPSTPSCGARAARRRPSPRSAGSWTAPTTPPPSPSTVSSTPGRTRSWRPSSAASRRSPPSTPW
ncbi:hypothetical protein [Streptomyces sp. AK010]|uniref:hypothetical protein n=1 Tax=Streptomyces sp. AK010 TaxID=2723074 RepID=UPI0017FD37FE|nr:hypothetical protein [Streptomyces sp. AK010]MBB6420765.1 hypothetical protein [Streptomyces sp. AK010]